MAKVMLFLGLLTLLFFAVKKLINIFTRHYERVETLIPFYGGQTAYWSSGLSPDEYILGAVFRWGRGKRIKWFTYTSGRDSLTTPMQALGVLSFLDDNFETTRDGAEIIESSTETDKNGATVMKWTFNYSPYVCGLSATAKSIIRDSIKNDFTYYLADKWPIKPEKAKDATEEALVNEINHDIRCRGWQDENGNRH